MKDTYNYPKTLRNYDDNLVKNKVTKNHSNSLTKSHKSISYSTHKPNRVVQSQTHNMDQYCILTNPSNFAQKLNKNNKKTKNKLKKSQSHLLQALKQHLKKPQFMQQTQIGTNNIVHCKSLQKLQIISNDRSQQIKRLIQQKAYLIAQNEQLKAKISNPTFRQQQYIQKIVKKQLEIQNLNHSLKMKEQRIAEIQKQYKLEIDRLKVKHKEQINNLREEINQLKYGNDKNSRTSYRNVKDDTSTSNANTYKPIIKTYQSSSSNNYKGTSSYQPISNQNKLQPSKTYTANTITYKAPQTTYTTIKASNQNSDNNYQKRTVHSTNYSQYLSNSTYGNDANKLTTQTTKKVSPLKYNAESAKVESYRTDSNTNQKQNYRTYIGEDGYQRRIYFKQEQQSKNQKYEVPKSTSSYNNQVATKNSYTLSSVNHSASDPYTKIYPSQTNKNVRFTNQKIITNLNPIQQSQNQSSHSKYTSVYRYGSGTTQDNSKKVQRYDNVYDTLSFGGENQNFYNNSLTFQAFDKLS